MFDRRMTSLIRMLRSDITLDRSTVGSRKVDTSYTDSTRLRHGTRFLFLSHFISIDTFVCLSAFYPKLVGVNFLALVKCQSHYLTVQSPINEEHVPKRVMLRIINYVVRI